MSRIGNAVIIVPKEVTVTVADGEVVVKGPKGELKMIIPTGISVSQADGAIEVKRKGDGKARRAIHGYVRAQLANLIVGVTRGWTRVLELAGVGYRAAVTGTDLTLNVGFSHPVVICPPCQRRKNYNQWNG